MGPISCSVTLRWAGKAFKQQTLYPIRPKGSGVEMGPGPEEKAT